MTSGRRASPLRALLPALLAVVAPVWAQNLPDAPKAPTAVVAELTAEQLLEDYKRALGPADQIRSFVRESRMEQGSERISGVHTAWSRDSGWKRSFPSTPTGQRVDYFDNRRAFIFSGRRRERFLLGKQ